jgi:CRP/FNR family putative post-exponential-phase nitrogen-starvation transcriptional regulator
MTENKGIYREKHTEASGYLGVTYRHLLYVIAEFVKEGLLEKSLIGYRITNRKKLSELAEWSDE